MSLQFEVNHFECTFANMPQALSCVLTEQTTWHLEIPLWQRKYDWGLEQFETFFKDLSVASAQKPLRLGTLVFACTKSNHETVWVVDGQQRLRTVNNLYMALSRSASENQDGATAFPIRAQQQLIHKLALTDGLGTPLDDGLCFNDEEQQKEFHKALSAVAHLLTPEILNNINFHIMLVTLSDKNIDQKVSLEVFNRLLPPYFERINRQAKPLNPEDVFKAKLIFKCRESSNFEAVHRVNACWDRAKRLIYEPMIRDPKFASISGSILDRITDKKPMAQCPLRDEKSRREAFCRLLLVADAWNRGEDKLPKIDRDTLLAETPLSRSWTGLWNINDLEVEKFLNQFDRLLSLFERYREYLLVTRSHLSDENLQRDFFEKNKNWRLVMLQLCCFLNAALSGHWLSNDYLLKIIRALDCQDEKDLDRAAKQAVQNVEKELFRKIKDKGSNEGKSQFGNSINNSRDREMLVAREWLLWQAYFSEFADDNEKSVYRDAVKTALKAVGGREIAVQDYIRMPFSYLPSSAGAGEIEHWVAMRREDQNKGDIKDEDLDRSANYAFIASGVNQSLRDLTVTEKALRRNNTWWPNLQFLAALTQPSEKGLPLEDRYATKKDLLAMFERIDSFWSKAQERILTSLDLCCGKS